MAARPRDVMNSLKGKLDRTRMPWSFDDWAFAVIFSIPKSKNVYITEEHERTTFVLLYRLLVGP